MAANVVHIIQPNVCKFAVIIRTNVIAVNESLSVPGPTSTGCDRLTFDIDLEVCSWLHVLQLVFGECLSTHYCGNIK